MDNGSASKRRTRQQMNEGSKALDDSPIPLQRTPKAKLTKAKATSSDTDESLK
jgi:hypothetical protein